MSNVHEPCMHLSKYTGTCKELGRISGLKHVHFTLVSMRDTGIYVLRITLVYAMYVPCMIQVYFIHAPSMVNLSDYSVCIPHNMYSM